MTDTTTPPLPPLPQPDGDFAATACRQDAWGASSMRAYAEAARAPLLAKIDRLRSNLFHAIDVAQVYLLHAVERGKEIERLRAELASKTFAIGDYVRKRSGSQWEGRVVGTYSTTLTPEGYAVESSSHAGSVQIYPVSALERGESKT